MQQDRQVCGKIFSRHNCVEKVAIFFFSRFKSSTHSPSLLHFVILKQYELSFRQHSTISLAFIDNISDQVKIHKHT